METTHQLVQAAAAHSAGHLDDAAAIYSKILQRQPQHADALHRLALLQVELGQLETALSHMQQARALLPESPEVLNNLGGLLLRLDQLDRAIDAYQKAATFAPTSALIHLNLGEALKKAGKSTDAITALRAAATLDPNLPAAWLLLGLTLLESSAPTAALPALAQAAKLDPNRLDSHYTLARAQMESNRITDAITSLQRCLQLDPHDIASIHELSKALFELGCVEKAMQLLRQAESVTSESSRTLILQNLAIIVPGSPADDNRSILQTRRAFNRQLPQGTPHSARPRSHSDPLRLGYVSSFFHRPNWMKPVWPLINAHDRTRFQIHLFSDAPLDRCTYAYRPYPSDQFHDITPLTNDAAAQLIRAQHLDLLIDLNGFSSPRRLPLFPLRPAPIQAAWFNLYATSGMDCFNYLIGDAHVIPPGEECFYTEKVLRVPHSYLTFHVDYPVPDVVPPPISTSSQLTFGCVASQYKITDQVIQSWAAILQATTARLLIRNRTLDRPEHQAHLLARFADCGISADRLQLQGPADHFNFLATYNHIDIALDTFPYSGGTTTTEALWQGVPVLTFNGDRWASRSSLSLLKAAALDEFIAPNLQAYIDLAITVANAPQTPARLTTLRRTLRENLRTSPLCDIPSFTRSMENLYQKML